MSDNTYTITIESTTDNNALRQRIYTFVAELQHAPKVTAVTVDFDTARRRAGERYEHNPMKKKVKKSKKVKKVKS